ncbi:MAG: class I SAM-dependent methyltransferase [Rhodospirillaceae bacterium]|nr:class I SAM-dependent methyltransferase [Rhodospirillaceae bacterium]
MSDALVRMERMYRPQARLYDLTRKHYLLGRDRLLETMPLRPGDFVCEVGCGTGRNLARLERRDPTLRLFGLDASAAMLERARPRTRARLARGLAEALDPAAQFGLDRPFDRIVFSYALSMFPDWRGALGQALTALHPGGTIAIVDFGEQRDWPRPLKRGLRAWLRRFDVNPIDGLGEYLDGLASAGAGRVETGIVAAGYAQLAFFEKT